MKRATFETFGPCWDQSGVRGFYGEGYWFHNFWSLLGLDMRGSTFVAKTTTLAARAGNMPLKSNSSPRAWFPDCVVVRPIAGVVLNAVGLSGPGLMTHIARRNWQERRRPFMISFMAVGEDKVKECEGFSFLWANHLPEMRTHVGIQLNLSCPNVGAKPQAEGQFLKEALACLDLVGSSGCAVFPKLSVTTNLSAMLAIAAHPSVAGLVVSNTVPWGALQDEIDWAGLFYGHTWAERTHLSDLDVEDVTQPPFPPVPPSPLAKYGGGALSGAPLLPLVRDLVKAAKRAGIAKPIAAGGGILHPEDVDVLVQAGADAICVGSAAILRPWRVGAIVRRAHELLTPKDGCVCPT